MENIRVDLHMHSVGSDGTWNAEEIVSEVKNKGIKLFAVTDHDSIEIARQIPELVKNEDLNFIMGVEISCTHNEKEHHLTTYNIDVKSKELSELIDDNTRRRLDFDNNVIKSFVADGYSFTYEEYQNYEEDVTRGAWKCFNFLIDKGLIDGLWDFFDKIKKYELSLNFRTPMEVIKIVKSIGAMPFLAHPSAYKKGERLTIEELDFWRDAGVVGIECYTPYNKEGDSEYYKDYCKKNNLLISGGSDCHGNYLERKLGHPEVYLSDLDLGDMI